MNTSFLRIIGIMLLAFIVLHTDAMAQGEGRQRTRVSQNNNGKSTYHWVDGNYSLKVEAEGDIEWTSDDRGIQSISRDGYFEIEEKGGRVDHRLVIERGSGGTLEYSYRRDGRQLDFDETGREWLADVLPQVIRESGIGAEARVARMLRDSGPERVLDDIELIKSPGAKTLYMLYLFEMAELDAGETMRAADLATDISSPGDKSRFLMAASKMFFIHDERVQEAYFDVVNSVSSPGDKTRVLINLVEEDVLDEEGRYIMALNTARTISSPGDKSRFMIKAVPFFVPSATEAYFETVNTISSPGDHARVLISLLENKDLTNDSMQPLLLSARQISSPGDKARVLMKAAEEMNGQVSDGVMSTFFDSSQSISSPGDHARVLIQVFNEVDMSDEAVLEWLEAAEGISSPGDKARVLLVASDRVADNETLVDAYLNVAETISAPGDRRRVLASLIE